VDCGNANRNNVALVPDLELMPIGDDPFGDMQTMALSQIGMGLGLEIVTPNDEQVLEVMSGGPTAGATFNDQCIDFAEFPSQECLEQHAAHCPDNQQNSYQELLSVLGPAQ
jgi:hypothetical protein